MQGGETPSTATACGSSDGSPSQLANLELDMPELPPFPGVPVTAVTYAPPGLGPPWPPLPELSLAEALGISDNGSESKAGEADAQADGDVDAIDAFVFKLTLRVADDMDLGLCFGKKGEALRIDSVESGAAESWNRQCSTSGSPERVLIPGDLVVSVNDQSDPETMLQECTTRKLLKLRVLRVRDHSSPDPNTVNAAKPWDTKHVQHVQYPLTFPTGLGYGRLGLICRPIASC